MSDSHSHQNATPVAQKNAESEQSTSLLALFFRLYWMILGHASIFLTALVISRQKTSVVVNLVYFLLVAGLIVARFIDIQFFHGETGEGAPATMAHWRKFSVLVIIYSTVLWLIVSLVIPK